jgi:hypothetical protein
MKEDAKRQALGERKQPKFPCHISGEEMTLRLEPRLNWVGMVSHQSGANVRRPYLLGKDPEALCLRQPGGTSSKVASDSCGASERPWSGPTGTSSRDETTFDRSSVTSATREARVMSAAGVEQHVH